MLNNEKKILEEIEYIFLDKEKGKSIFIDGLWGIGKTYFFNNVLKTKFNELGYKVIYISLLGINDFKELKKIIVTELVFSSGFMKKQIFSKDAVKRHYSICIKESFFKKILNYADKLNEAIRERDISICFSLPIDFYVKLINENIVFCFDDCERLGNDAIISEFLGVIEKFKENKLIKTISIGNTSFLSKTCSINIYKEKIFDRGFTLTKSINDIVGILQSKLSVRMQHFYEKVLNNIFASKKIHIKNLSAEEFTVYNKSKDVFTNIRVIKQITDGIKRIDDFLIKNNMEENISNEGLLYIVYSAFFFGFLKASSTHLLNFKEYENVFYYNESSSSNATYPEIIVEQLGDIFIKIESVYIYFKNGYLDEELLKENINKYIKSELTSYMDKLDINNYLLTLLTKKNKELLSIKDKIIEEINKSNSSITFKGATDILRMLSHILVLTKANIDDRVIEMLSEKIGITTDEEFSDLFYSINKCIGCEYLEEQDKLYVKLRNKLISLVKINNARIINEVIKEKIKLEDVDAIMKILQRSEYVTNETMLVLIDWALKNIIDDNKDSYITFLYDITRDENIRRILSEKINEYEKNNVIRSELSIWLKFILKIDSYIPNP